MSLSLTPVYELASGDFAPLSAALSPNDVQRFLHAVLAYGQADQIPKTPVQLINALVSEAELTRVLAGGLLIKSDAIVIEPSCCCGLEEWHFWFEALSDGPMPFFGHDPVIWTARERNCILIHASLGNGDDRNPPFDTIRTSRMELAAALTRAESQLREAMHRVAAFAREHNPANEEQLMSNLDRWFGPVSVNLSAAER